MENLFDHAGVELPATPAEPRRPRKLAPPSPAACAASGRLEGARRSWPLSRMPRDRVGPARDLSQRRVYPFPLSRNPSILAETIKNLPHGSDAKLNARCDYEARKLEKKLMRRGIPRQLAQECASELLAKAHSVRVSAAYREV